METENMIQTQENESVHENRESASPFNWGDGGGGASMDPPPFQLTADNGSGGGDSAEEEAFAAQSEKALEEMKEKEDLEVSFEGDEWANAMVEEEEAKEENGEAEQGAESESESEVEFQSVDADQGAEENPIQRVINFSTIPGRNGRPDVRLLTVRAVLVDETGTYNRAQLRRISERIKRQFSQSYSGANRRASIRISLAARIPPNAHVIRIVNQGNIPGRPGRMGILGRAPFGQNVLYLSRHIIARVPAVAGPNVGTGRDAGGRGTLERTSAHEMGHSLSLRHPAPGTSPGNLMNQTGQPDAGTNISEAQIANAENAMDTGQLNQGNQG